MTAESALPHPTFTPEQLDAMHVSRTVIDALEAVTRQHKGASNNPWGLRELLNEWGLVEVRYLITDKFGERRLYLQSTLVESDTEKVDAAFPLNNPEVPTEYRHLIGRHAGIISVGNVAEPGVTDRYMLTEIIGGDAEAQGGAIIVKKRTEYKQGVDFHPLKDQDEQFLTNKFREDVQQRKAAGEVPADSPEEPSYDSIADQKVVWMDKIQTLEEPRVLSSAEARDLGKLIVRVREHGKLTD